MILIKSTCLICVFTLSTLIGFLKAAQLKDRVIELNKIESSLLLFKTKIEYTNETIGSIFDQISNIIYNNSENIFSFTIKNLSKNEIEKNWCLAISQNNKLKNGDEEILKLFGKNLGKLDKKGQIDQINETINLIKKQIKEAESYKEKNEKLYRSLGSIAGATIVLILI